MRLGEILELARLFPWVLEVLKGIAEGMKPTEAMYLAAMEPHVGEVAERSGLEEAEVEKVLKTLAERLG
jgi:hypothetical protein